ncbi:MAG: FxLYD domain-containing protein [Pseudomonadota bacterium]
MADANATPVATSANTDSVARANVEGANQGTQPPRRPDTHPAVDAADQERRQSQERLARAVASSPPKSPTGDGGKNPLPAVPLERGETSALERAAVPQSAASPQNETTEQQSVRAEAQTADAAYDEREKKDTTSDDGEKRRGEATAVTTADLAQRNPPPNQTSTSLSDAIKDVTEPAKPARVDQDDETADPSDYPTVRPSTQGEDTAGAELEKPQRSSTERRDTPENQGSSEALNAATKGDAARASSDATPDPDQNVAPSADAEENPLPGPTDRLAEEKSAVAPQSTKNRDGDARLPAPTVPSPPGPVVADPALSAELGEMFATPPASLGPVDRRAPLGVPDGLIARSPTAPARAASKLEHDGRDAQRPPAFDETAIDTPDPAYDTAGRNGVTPQPMRRQRIDAAATPDPTLRTPASPGTVRANGAAGAQPAPTRLPERSDTAPAITEFRRSPETDFVAPDDIAPDPAFDRSHIDIRTDTPFATDFAAPPAIGAPTERRGAQTQTAVVRRRAAIHLGWFSLATIIGVIAGIAVLAPDRVVAMLPGAATLYRAAGIDVNLRGLDFSGISYEWTRENGRSAIDVTGRIRNVSSSAREVPTVVFVLFDARGDELFNWARRVHNAPIAAGDEISFSARVPAPPDATRKLRVRFARPVR